VCYRWEADGSLEWCCARQWEQGFDRLPDLALAGWEAVAGEGHRLFLPAQRLCLWVWELPFEVLPPLWAAQADSLDGPDDDGPEWRSSHLHSREVAQQAAEAWAAQWQKGATP
jgi:hypothetical protein